MKFFKVVLLFGFNAFAYISGPDYTVTQNIILVPYTLDELERSDFYSYVGIGPVSDGSFIFSMGNSSNIFYQSKSSSYRYRSDYSFSLGYNPTEISDLANYDFKKSSFGANFLIGARAFQKLDILFGLDFLVSCSEMHAHSEFDGIILGPILKVAYSVNDNVAFYLSITSSVNDKNILKAGVNLHTFSFLS